MKKSLFTIFLIAICVFLSECRKDPKPDVFKVTEVDVDASYKTAKINGSYTFNVIPDDMKIVYGENNDLTDAISSKVNVGESDFHVNISNLKTGTKYYYCFECYSSHSFTRSEIHSFVTLKTDKPIVETVAVENITMNSASCRGNVTSDGGATVTARGVCWSTNQNPTIDDNKTTDGNGIGSFTSNLSNLAPQTTYYVRAYATNEMGTSYGEQKTFTTLEKEAEPTPPTVTTSSVSSVTSNSATCGGNVTDDGGATVTARGICWSTSQNPTINDNKTTDGKGEGEFTSNMTGLTAGTTYYVRAYATNEKGTSYGDEKTFVTNIIMNLPTVTTRELEDITETSATSGGEVVSDGGATVTARGVCWSKSQNPTIYDNKTSDGAGIGIFTSQLLNLAPQTTYYVRAYATNIEGTAYGEQRSFTTEEEEPEPTPPTVTTSSVSSVTSNSATCGGKVTDDGGATVTARGICWSTSQNPTINDNKTTDGKGEGEFTSNMTGLTAGTTYYVRAYATNEKGTSYGDEKTFVTNIIMNLPTVTTRELEDITETSATSGGEVVSDGGATVTARGVCWSTNQNPTIDDNKTTDGNGTGSFTSILSNLAPQTTYYVRAYATNIEGTAYGEQRSFTTEEEEPETTLPTVTTFSVQDITSNSATCGGNVTDDGGTAIKARGVCWSTSQNPTIDDNDVYSITNGTGTGSFTSHLSNLASQTTYYVRAYATNSAGTAYGEQRSFTTEEEEHEPTPPTITTFSVRVITSNSATSGGNVTSNGGATVTARGVCWSTSHNPTINDNEGYTTDGVGTGTFMSQLSDLTPNTTYYVRAYATNSVGTAYGEEKSFTTEEEPEESICEPDGEIDGYSYVDLGLPSGLLWATYNIGASKPEEHGNYYAWGETETKSTYDSDNSVTYGEQMSDFSGNTQYDAALANWGESWRMPTREDMIELVDHCEWEWVQVNGVSGSKVIGLNGSCIFLPAAGIRDGASLYHDSSSYYWCSTPNDDNSDDRAYSLCSYDGNENVGSSGFRYWGLPIRPVTGGNSTEHEPTLPTVTTFSVQEITSNSATCGGEVTSDGEAAVIAKGVCWSTSQNPTINNNRSNNGNGIGMFTSQLINLASQTTYYVRAYATNSAGTAYGEQKTFTTLEEEPEETICEPDGEVDGYSYVDLGLPSGLLWATYNIGASKPEEYGNYYAWGETETKDEYTDVNSLTHGLSQSELLSQGIIDNYNLTPSHDAATINWSENWRMPTAYEMQELIYNCNWEQIQVNGVYGIKFTAHNGNCIFLPMAGLQGSSPNLYGERGFYWSSNIGSDRDEAYYLFVDTGMAVYGDGARAHGFSIRPVSGGNLETICEPDGEIDGYSYVDLGLPSGLKWATINVGATSPTESGEYFAWGETEEKDTYTVNNSQTYGLTISELLSQGIIDENYNLTPSHDAATVNWSENWRMPTKEEIQELVEYCTWGWTQVDGMNGTKVTGPNGKCIFVPKAGWCEQTSKYNFREGCYYWSSTPDEDFYYAYNLSYTSRVGDCSKKYRSNGLPIRPVTGGNSTEHEPTLPTVTTSSVSDVTTNSATCGGEVTSDGEAAVIAKGVCWSTSQNPTINNNRSNNGNGIGTFTSQLINLASQTTYYVRAYATNSAGTAYGEQKTFTTLEEEPEETICEPDGEVDGYSYVDLGLPSGLKWATCNVGASKPEEYGNYYAWGETSPKTVYEWNTYQHWNDADGDGLCDYGESTINSDISGNAQYDAATANLGGSWRMPTRADMEELVNNCTFEWIQVNGVNGAKVEGPNGGCIFLPAAGFRVGTSLNYFDGRYGNYWSSTPYYDVADDCDAYGLHSSDDGWNVGWNISRTYGQTIRPVSD